jgi:competence ComEA-like helix-hairpin-helix protein
MGKPQSSRQSRSLSSHHLVLVTGVIVAGVAVVWHCASGWRVAGPHDGASQAIELRLDPNLASAEELAAIPGVGPAMAGRIVAYRNREIAAGRAPAFSGLDDLDRVAGIGKATLEAIGPSLRFGAARQ